MRFADGKAGECERKWNPKTEYLNFTTNGDGKSFHYIYSGEKKGSCYLREMGYMRLL